MELMDAINGRRSVRKFKPDPVPEDTLRSLVEAASMAPSGSNVQAWKFGLVTDPELVRVVDRFSPGMGGTPPAVIAVCTDRRYALERGGEFAAETMARLDAAYASQNIMLAAHALGLGTCAIKSYNEPAVRRLLRLPEHMELELLISLGYPDHEPRTPRRKGFDEIAFSNVWPDGEGVADAQPATAADSQPVTTAADSQPVAAAESAAPSIPAAPAISGASSSPLGCAAWHEAEYALDGDQLFDLLAYMLASAAGLEKEPAIYGPLRLAEASQRLASMMAGAAGSDAARLRELVNLIAARKNDCMTEPESFYRMVGEATLALVGETADGISAR